ncbi:MAG: magnesium chelatase [Halobacteriales archaeon SW_9_67_25]|nr:MAG: magnesium chelatase [Halobacteriales archaeon SW_9_67_25]
MMVSYGLAEGLTVGVEHLWPLAVLPVAALLLAYLVFRDGGDRSASARSRRLLFLSRLVIVILLVVAAMGPYTVQTRETPGEPRVTLLTDESESMGVYPNVTADLVADVEAEGVPVTRATVGSGTDSRVGDGIVANLRENGTVVVLSDGQVTTGRSLQTAAEAAASLNTTVSTVDTSPDRTERVVSLSGPSTVTIGLSSEFVVSLSGVEAEDPVPVTVSVDGETVREENLAAGNRIRVNQTFEERGTHRVTATIESDDIYGRNDVFYHTVRVVEKPDVLYVAQGEYPLRGYLGSAVVVQDIPADRLGNVSTLQEHVISGGGLVSVGGDNAYESGGYGQSPIASLLPVRVGEATGGATNIVLLVDISGSTREDLDVQKGIALDILDQLGDANRVGLVAFGSDAYRVAEIQELGGSREEMADRIRRLQPEDKPGTDIANGLLGADEMLGDRRGTIILLSDGFVANSERPVVVANQLGREGRRIIGVGAAQRVNVPVMRRIAEESGGSYFNADERSRLRLLFGSASRQFQGDGLTIVTPGTFITSGVELTANSRRANEVAVKSGADYQVATADGTPAIASWRFGLGRAVSITAYANDGTLGGLLEEPDSLVVTKSVNFAIGDPARESTGVIRVSDARVGEPATLTYRGAERPTAPEVSFRQVAERTYEGEFTPGSAGYGEVLNATYAANYPSEYGRFGTSRELNALVRATGGQSFETDDGEAIARLAQERSTEIRSVRESWDWVALLLALLAFALEVGFRRLQVYRGRTTLESGLT